MSNIQYQNVRVRCFGCGIVATVSMTAIEVLEIMAGEAAWACDVCTTSLNSHKLVGPSSEPTLRHSSIKIWLD